MSTAFSPVPAIESPSSSIAESLSIAVQKYAGAPHTPAKIFFLLSFNVTDIVYHRTLAALPASVVIGVIVFN
jgi:hypothetical protein